MAKKVNNGKNGVQQSADSGYSQTATKWLNYDVRSIEMQQQVSSFAQDERSLLDTIVELTERGFECSIKLDNRSGRPVAYVFFPRDFSANFRAAVSGNGRDGVSALACAVFKTLRILEMGEIPADTGNDWQFS